MKLLFGSGMATVAAAALAAVVWAGTSPLALPAAESSKSPQGLAGHGPEAGAIPPLSAFEGVYASATRLPLSDTQVSAAPVITPPIAAPDASGDSLHLVGTAIERGHSLAFFRTNGTNVEFRGIGQKIGDATVTDIQHDAVILSVDGRLVTLKVDLPSANPAPGSPSIPTGPADQDRVIEVPPIRTGADAPP